MSFSLRVVNECPRSFSSLPIYSANTAPPIGILLAVYRSGCPKGAVARENFPFLLFLANFLPSYTAVEEIESCPMLTATPVVLPVAKRDSAASDAK